eukprot:CAMPEP_0172478996 /NCGR_PEP_ID=MMETSP1066-20121228/3261_1 /TAXON_ID=671091 /ORGANISM="Coscinodiscus wailesii, Strain CCMP2513" /LENGTH=153 /DNA_ID=CAMNT_0013239023 /DNA_START=50 /DNA_END=511 /DNA_ORIENTATION=-
MKVITTLLLTALPTFATAFVAPPSSSSLSRHSSSSLTELFASIEFIRGLTEKDVPDVKLTRARDGSSGTATFRFNSPNCFDASTQAAGDVTGMFMIDEEGEMSTNDVNARFVNGKPQSIESTYVMTSPESWDRFMRFMERYAEANDLGFNSAS